MTGLYVPINYIIVTSDLLSLIAVAVHSLLANRSWSLSRLSSEFDKKDCDMFGRQISLTRLFRVILAGLDNFIKTKIVFVRNAFLIIIKYYNYLNSPISCW